MFELWPPSGLWPGGLQHQSAAIQSAAIRSLTVDAVFYELDAMPVSMQSTLLRRWDVKL